MPARKSAGSPSAGRPSGADAAGARSGRQRNGRAVRTSPAGRLVIVESPAKAKTISGYLGPGWTVESSIGHIRDLPANAATVPDAYKGQQWARLGVDVDNGFEPLYVVMPDKQAQVRKLKSLLAASQELYLATDEDREGEAIAWHLRETLKPRVPVRRMVFHEITRQAIELAADHPRDIDQHLVDAQETRRILDRLYGYEVSPVLWKKVRPGLSAGRVQSVATRILVERERERIRFRSASYWGIDGVFAARPPGRDQGRADSPAQPPLPAALVGAERPADRDRPRLLRVRGADLRRRRPARRGRGARPCRPAGRHRLHRAQGRGEAVPAVPVPAVHDQHLAAGGRTQAALLQPAHDAGGAAALRERLHHLHAHRLHDAVGVRRGRRAGAGARAATGPTTSPTSRGRTPARSRTPRRRTRRSGRPGSTSARPGRLPASCRLTNGGCTS